MSTEVSRMLGGAAAAAEAAGNDLDLAASIYLLGYQRPNHPQSRCRPLPAAIISDIMFIHQPARAIYALEGTTRVSAIVRYMASADLLCYRPPRMHGSGCTNIHTPHNILYDWRVCLSAGQRGCLLTGERSTLVFPHCRRKELCKYGRIVPSPSTSFSHPSLLPPGLLLVLPHRLLRAKSISFC